MYEASRRVREQIQRSFTYQLPRPDQVPRYEEIRAKALEFATYLSTVCPESREQSLALTHLEEVVMYANAAIARNEASPAEAG